MFQLTNERIIQSCRQTEHYGYCVYLFTLTCIRKEMRGRHIESFNCPVVISCLTLSAISVLLCVSTCYLLQTLTGQAATPCPDSSGGRWCCHSSSLHHNIHFIQAPSPLGEPWSPQHTERFFYTCNSNRGSLLDWPSVMCVQKRLAGQLLIGITFNYILMD